MTSKSKRNAKTNRAADPLLLLLEVPANQIPRLSFPSFSSLLPSPPHFLIRMKEMLGIATLQFTTCMLAKSILSSLLHILQGYFGIPSQALACQDINSDAVYQEKRWYLRYLYTELVETQAAYAKLEFLVSH